MKDTTGEKEVEKKKPVKKEPAKKKQATPKITRYGTRTAARRKSIVPHGSKQKETMEDNNCNEMSDDED